ncbi:MAG: hypothetical protein QXR26_02025 [Candidatus Caldarchaeum sp.]
MVSVRLNRWVAVALAVASPALAITLMATPVVFQQNRAEPIDVKILVDRLLRRPDDIGVLLADARSKIMACMTRLAQRWAAMGYSTEGPPPDETIRMPGELIQVWGCPDAFITIKYGSIQPMTKADLVDLFMRRVTLLRLMVEAAPDYTTEAIITPVKPLTPMEFEGLVSSLGLKVTWTGYDLVRLDTGESVAGGV